LRSHPLTFSPHIKPAIEQSVGFKKIGKAALKGTKHIGKTLTAISDSPDRRGQGRVAQLNTPQFYSRENRKEKGKKVMKVAGASMGLDAGMISLRGAQYAGSNLTLYGRRRGY